MNFKEMGLNPKLVEGLKLMGITTPTPIQEKCIPQIKAGKDVVGQSLTGSGKTAAFGLPILEKIVPGAGLQALVLVPTRELCVQVRDNLESYAKFLPINLISVYGGVGFFQQMEEIKFGEVMVATPGRLLDHIGRGNVNLKNVKYVVLDEADRMFDMGFEDDVDRILRQTPHTRQTIMFSATMPKAAQNLIVKYLKNPAYIQEKLQVDKSLLKQVFYSIGKHNKFSLLVHLLKSKTVGPAIVFCGTKREVDRVARQLRRQKIDALPVHGDLTQGKRQFAVNSFKNSKIDVLVATDVAARGLDIKDVTHVYNYDVPRTPEEYTHRIGRTARAGKKGEAVTLLSERDYDNFNKILRYGKVEILQEKVPEYERIDIAREEFGHERGSYPQERFHSQGQGRFESRGRFENRGERNFQGRNERTDQRRSNSWTQGEYSPRSFERRNQPRYSNNRRDNFGYSNKRDNYQNQREYAPANSQYESQPAQTTHERTPRTAKPLFPSSHYNPDYKKYEVKGRESSPKSSGGQGGNFQRKFDHKFKKEHGTHSSRHGQNNSHRKRD